MIVATMNSTYEFDMVERKVRRVEGAYDPTPRFGEDGEWREFYAEDITRLLNEPEVLTPDKQLSHRRIAVAWAVAEVLRANDDVT